MADIAVRRSLLTYWRVVNLGGRIEYIQCDRATYDRLRTQQKDKA